MRWLLATFLGTGSGVLAGFLIEHLPMPPIAQSVLAFLGCMVLGDLYAARILASISAPAVRPVASYVSFGTENLIFLGMLFVVGVVAHFALSFLGGQLAVIAAHRPIALGIVGGVIGTLFGVWAMTAE